MTLAAGTLNTRIVISRRASGLDSWGQPSETWETVATVWASVLSPTGRAAAEMLSADRQISATTYSMRIRWRTDVTAAMRVTQGSTVFDIAQVIPDIAGRRYVDLVCTTGASQG